MPPTEITTWLTQTRRRGIRNALGDAAVTLLGGVFVSALMVSVIFVAAKAALLSTFPPPSIMGTVLSALIALIAHALIFTVSFRARRDAMTLLLVWLLRPYISIGPRLV